MDKFEWIGENVAGPGIDPAELEANFEGCQCLGECSETSGCSCLLDGKSNFDSNGRFLHLASSLSISSQFSAPHLECSSHCECALFPERCTNRRVQNGVQHKLKVAECQGKGFGVFADEYIPSGHFVVEYVGEVIGREEAERRLTNQKVDEHNYLFTIREYIGGKCQYTFIDGRHRGNISRFINHSCEPNLQLQLFRIGRQSPSLAMFAARDIQAGEELSYSYGFLSVADDNEKNESNKNDGKNDAINVLMQLSGKECRCGAPNCLGRLPSASTI